jgi:hypothetical protein
MFGRKLCCSKVQIQTRLLLAFAREISHHGFSHGCPGVMIPQRKADGVDNVSRPSISAMSGVQR